MTERVLIAGCGYVGSALAERLTANGHTVYGLRRSAPTGPEAFRPVVADLRDPILSEVLPDALDIVFFTAGASGFSDDDYEQTYVVGLRNLLAAVAAQPEPPRRVVFTSSTAVYAQTDGDWVDEESPTEPDSFSGKRMLEAESLLAASRIPSVSVRLGGIYGPGRIRLVDRVRSGEAKRERGPTRYLNLIHREDIVGVLMHLMMLNEPCDVYVGVDSEPQEWNGLVEWIAEAVGVPAPGWTDAHQTRGRPFRSRRCSNRRLLDSGYTFRYPSAREGYRELIGDCG